MRQKYKIIRVDKWLHSPYYPIQLCNGVNYYFHLIDEETSLKVVEGLAKVTQLLAVWARSPSRSNSTTQVFPLNHLQTSPIPSLQVICMFTNIYSYPLCIFHFPGENIPHSSDGTLNHLPQMSSAFWSYLSRCISNNLDLPGLRSPSLKSVL